MGTDINIENPELKTDIKPIVFACDENYAPYLSVVIRSIMDNAHSSFHYEIIILDCSKNQHSEGFSVTMISLREMVALNPKFSLKLIRVSEILAKNVFLQKNKQALKRYSYGTYARILIPDLLPSYDRVLYLDVDHIVLGDIAELFELPLHNKIIASVPDVSAAYMRLVKRFKRKKLIEDVLNLEIDDCYIIASPMLFDVRACRNFGFTDKVLGFLTENYDLPFPDQDAINSVCKGKIFYLPQKWGRVNSGNFTKLCNYIQKNMDKKYSEIILGDWREDAENPAIIHYVASPKPWAGTRPNYSGLWWRYAAKTKGSMTLLVPLLFPTATPYDREYTAKSYKLFGLTVLTLRIYPQEEVYRIASLPFLRKVYGKENIYFYICGIKFFSICDK